MAMSESRMCSHPIACAAAGKLEIKARLEGNRTCNRKQEGAVTYEGYCEREISRGIPLTRPSINQHCPCFKAQ